MYWDDELDAYCTFRPAADGVTRCLPKGLDTGGSRVFADAECTVPVRFWGADCEDPLPEYMEVEDEAINRVYLRGEPFDATSNPMYLRVSSGCGSVGLTSSPDRPWYSAGAEIEPEAFVAEELETVVIQDYLQAVVRRTEDGLVDLKELQMSETGQRCEFKALPSEPAESSALACQPPSVFARIAYSSFECNEPVGYFMDDGEFAWREGDAGFVLSRFQATGLTSAYRLGDDGVCALGLGFTISTVAEDLIPEKVFAITESAVESVGPDLSVTTYDLPSASPAIASWALSDAESCAPTEVRGGVRCLPPEGDNPPDDSYLRSDPECDRLVRVFTEPSGDLDYGVWVACGTGSYTVVQTPGSPIEETLYSPVTGTCEPYDDDVYEVVDTAGADFPALELEVEP